MGWYMLLSSGIIVLLLSMVAGMTFSLTKITLLAKRYPDLDDLGHLLMLKSMLITASAGFLLLALAICLQFFMLTLQSGQIGLAQGAVAIVQCVGVVTVVNYYWRTARRHFTH